MDKGALCYVLGSLSDKMTSAEIEELVDEASAGGGTLTPAQFMGIMKITASTGADRAVELSRRASSRANGLNLPA